MDKYHQQARLLKLMAHPVRLRILDLLRVDDECVCHLSAALDKSQPYVSQQLAVLRIAGLITDRKDGNNVFYRLTDERTARQVEALLGAPPEARACGTEAHHQPVNGCNCPKCAAAEAA